MAKSDMENVLSKKEKEQLKSAALKELNGEIKDELVTMVVTDVKKELNKTLEDVKETIDIEYKAELKAKISNELVDDIKERIRKDEVKLSKRKSWKIFRLNIMLLIVLAVALYLVYILYKNDDLELIRDLKNNNSTTTQEITEAPTTTTQVVKDNEWYLNNYGYLMNNIVINNYTILKTNVIVSNLNIKDKLAMVYLNLKPENIGRDGVIYQISKEVMMEAYRSLFGENDSFETVDFTVDNMNFAYSSATASFIAIVNDVTETGRVVNQIDTITETDEFIIVNCNTGVKINNKVYSIEDGTKLNKLTKLTYKFKKTDSGYYLYSITR